MYNALPILGVQSLTCDCWLTTDLIEEKNFQGLSGLFDVGSVLNSQDLGREKANNTRILNYMRQINRETKENKSDKKGKMLLLYKCSVLDESRKVITEVVTNSYKGSHRRVIFYFLDNLIISVFH